MDITKIMTFAVVMGLIMFFIGMFGTMLTDNIYERWGRFWEVIWMTLVVIGILGIFGGLITLITVWTFFS